MLNLTMSPKSPLILLIASYLTAMLMLDAGGGDLWLAKQLYNLQGHDWLLRDHWLTEQVLHRGARSLNYLLSALVLLLTAKSLRSCRQNRELARSYLALSISLLSSFAVVAGLKAVTNAACPWDLSVFGGTEMYYHLFQSRPAELPTSRCFPAGHASVGYAWVALYFFFARVNPQRRWLGLATGLAAGLVLGIDQQLRGAHFLSHDLTTLMLCLLCAKLSFFYLTAQRHVNAKPIPPFTKLMKPEA